MEKRRIQFVMLLLVMVLGVGCERPSTPATPTPSPTVTGVPATELTDLQPWANGQLRPEFTVADEQQGACWLGSLVVARPDAWRCAYQEGENLRVLDPCFANRDNPNGELACLNADNTVTLLTLQEPLPEEFANSTAVDQLPLKVVLANGDECGLLLGATITLPVNGEEQRVNYACNSGGVLIGLPDKQGEGWTMSYNADPQGGAALETVQIVQAFTFNGMTANVGGAPIGNGTAVLTTITSEAMPGKHQFTFQFASEAQPAFEIGYVNEPYANIPEGAKVLRVAFTYPGEADYSGERTVTGDYPAHVNEVKLVLDDGRELVWALGLDEMVGFDVNRNGDQLIFTLYEPVPNATERPDLGVGSQGTAVRVVQEKLHALGYLAEIPPGEKYDEPTRKAVVAFQEDHGIIPNGVVGAETWAALERDVPPPAGSSNFSRVTAKINLNLQETPQVTPNTASGANIRSGPAMDYEVIALLPAGQTVDVIGIVEGSSLETTWPQVCCVNGVAGWVRADVVRVSGSTADLQGPSPDQLAPVPPDTSGMTMPSQRPSHTASGQPILYFTFDDGPSNHTSEVTAAMQQYGGQTTFFVIGLNVDALPAEAKAAFDAGHAVENHTYHHQSLDQLGATELFNEIEANQIAIQQATGHNPLCLRPPYGETNQMVYQQVAEMGLEVVLWDIDTQDWRRPGTAAIATHIMDSVFPGAILLMHDGGGDRSQSVAALQQVLPQLQAQGYVFGVLCR